MGMTEQCPQREVKRGKVHTCHGRPNSQQTTGMVQFGYVTQTVLSDVQVVQTTLCWTYSG